MKFFKASLVSLAFAMTCTAWASEGNEQPTYNFSPVNQYNVQLTASFWNPVIEYVSRKSGVRLNLKIGRTSADTTSYVLAKEVDFAFTNHLFSPERSKMGWKVFGRRDMPAVRAQIVVPADSPITNLSDLNGQDIAFPGPEAFIAYKVPYSTLLQQDIQINPIFAGNHDGAFSQLLSGRVKAVGANSQLVDGYAKREGKSFRVLWNSVPYNELALMVSPRVPDSQAKAVADAFLNMHRDPTGQAILSQVSALVKLPTMARFVPAKDIDYQSYRDFYTSAPAKLQ